MIEIRPPPFRADHVGSFLRPKALLEARERHQKGTLSRDALRLAEDDAIRAVVRLQEQCGVRGITDGEFRRTYFHIDFLERLEGVEARGGIAGASGEHAPPVLHVTGKVKHVAPILVADFEFLRAITNRTPKVTMPSPTMLHFRGGREAISRDAYPDLEAFYEDVAACYRTELRALGDAGCAYVQLDDTNLAYLCDPQMRSAARLRGDDPDELPLRYAKWINSAIADRPEGMTVCTHLCRGNFKSKWFAEGSYEPVAEVLFNALDVNGYFLEYDDARSGGFAPLRFLPKGKKVVLGLVTTKQGRLETKDDLRRRIDEAAGYAPLDQLCLSPQCGFSSTVHGNEIQVESQAAKLRLIVEVAREVWGET